MDLSAKVNVNFARVDVFFFKRLPRANSATTTIFFHISIRENIWCRKGAKKKIILNTEIPLLIHDAPYKISTKYTEPFLRKNILLVLLFLELALILNSRPG